MCFISLGSAECDQKTINEIFYSLVHESRQNLREIS